ncbi:hypothetical protein [Demequina sp. NBRC 110052]|uniref:hypothetical protein n=1 Tax=Demequina sp. NBRC 110052 TaxID=1570341 RepID=UPI001180013B|nr:hypothetical protein [Demequina sp. NBRC 110052]
MHQPEPEISAMPGTGRQHSALRDRPARPDTGDALRNTMRTTTTRPSQRRLIHTLTTAAITALTLTGCVFAIDPPHPTVEFFNDSNQTVIFTVEYNDGGPDAKAVVVEPHLVGSSSVDVCTGQSIRVETETGEVLGRTTEPACPNWLLTVHEDGTLTYEDKS